ncbi:hypothetical protein SLS60_002385 [Paraconiothyrium brasiliense]|uniref:F-box domain-containing protein n=1 Tax=Paraconiothyrium brasiliense TaxID=300254 RepID=A0ABR3S208_9PLEO
MTGFLFLKLPAEIRNQIYELAASSEQPTSIHKKPMRTDGDYIGLARVCRQIRKEFLSCKSALRYHGTHTDGKTQVYRNEGCIRVGWNDLDAWLSTFGRSNVQPKQLRIAVPLRVPGTDSVSLEVDLLPLIDWKLTSDMTTCEVVFVNVSPMTSVPDQFKKRVQSRRERMMLQLRNLLECNDAAWHADVEDDASRLKRVLINLEHPSITFMLRPNDRCKAPDGIEYMREVGLRLVRGSWWSWRVTTQVENDETMADNEESTTD